MKLILFLKVLNGVHFCLVRVVVVLSCVDSAGHVMSIFKSQP